ncbi:hypothetical protein PV325_011153 [Microctonus aethiopoides]|uniref:Gustatory receptor n=1 Tax=Microctonus aethiopoides TaxID=144406 RepID=A0AA39C5I0_9HYME|nr:hypothetical protein PV325_011153 [Microctonus aethiopoides]KAK0157835.1 hypothetical protein PV328_011525 [Microctonus aethiopoides]
MEYPNKSEVTSMIIFLKAIIGTSVLIILWINIWNKKYDAINCGNKFITITNAILKLHHLYLNNSIEYRIAGVIFINISIWISLLTCDGIMFPNFLGFSAISLALPNFICSWFLLQYAFALMLIKKQFNNLNCSILKLSTRKLTLNYFRGSISSQVPLSNQLIIDLFTIRKNYKLMCEIVREIRFMFSFSILIIIVLFNINIITTTYYFVQPLFQSEIPWSFFVTLDTLSYLAMELFPIIIMTTSVTQLINEMNSTADAIYGLMNEPIRDQEFKTQLEEFSFELLHRTIKFDACNILPLDRTLLHSIASMTTTYLIILIQYSLGRK